MVFLMALLHFPLPVVMFGHFLRGQLGAAVLALTTVLTLAAAVGLWKPQHWSYPLIITLQSFWRISGAVTFLSPSYERNMREVFEEMHMPATASASEVYMHNHVWVMIMGLLPSLVILLILLYYRAPFGNAADRGKSPSFRINKQRQVT
jgi:hypothetical protein